MGECATSSSDNVTSFCTVEAAVTQQCNNLCDDVVDLMEQHHCDQSTGAAAVAAAAPSRRYTSVTPAADRDCKPPSPPDASSDDSAASDDERRAADELSLPDEALRHELDLFRTTRAMLVSTATLWLPLTLANIVYALSESSRGAMTLHEVMAVKWMAYSSPLVDYVICALFSEAMRQAAWMSVRRCRAYCLAVGQRRRSGDSVKPIG